MSLYGAGYKIAVDEEEIAIPQLNSDRALLLGVEVFHRRPESQSHLSIEFNAGSRSHPQLILVRIDLAVLVAALLQHQAWFAVPTWVVVGKVGCGWIRLAQERDRHAGASEVVGLGGSERGAERQRHRQQRKRGKRQRPTARSSGAQLRPIHHARIAFL
jgi:hypothetical protein